ncbi:hypothetical protein COU62_04185 [Candidatus Pacearchaeota archaeon CG10_big_fil_rev_8_21_14_0_10_35_219]|nr:hypothetical protein [Candidatus Pacearchaeota archaeon]OIO42222.1 MAG: hypothetical protein AUJ63_02985 [Candidatus Pacearchaeota archaeon CG1_02_35_32]PIO07309.1 MAG: hypothetical protein COU62_04185 [Candidatus Pacearchaeota archaeon CG10_big_fil_rev_8_21_14_0_10_35_219]PIY81359.1 MAG: hypothetical protein COY79_03730 [Candidatus Pacearchaeota archaeon CG_4_10_14_0_8_um_filter_35_169]PIZ79815.1 MAG: hypothetical protein COY00_03235 [Candidatus Pacearchaeota archaeon CG_4_10_14_0_2_um_filt
MDYTTRENTLSREDYSLPEEGLRTDTLLKAITPGFYIKGWNDLRKEGRLESRSDAIFYTVALFSLEIVQDLWDLTLLSGVAYGLSYTIN